MVDLGISRTQDIQNPIQANTPISRIQPDGQERRGHPATAKTTSRSVEESQSGEKMLANLDKEVKRLNDLLGSGTRIQFAINRSTNAVFIEVVDKETNEVIKTIPPSDLAGIASKLSEGGILVDNRS